MKSGFANMVFWRTAALFPLPLQARWLTCMRKNILNIKAGRIMILLPAYPTNFLLSFEYLNP
jgi:hypothetical protein